MMTIFRYSFSNLRGQVLGWGLGLGALGAFLVQFYDTLAEQQDQLDELISSFPPEMMAFFGDMTQLFTPAGYLDTEFFSYMPLILGIFAVLIGSGLIIGDEQNGTLDLILAYPVSRTALFFGRLLAFLAALLAILVVVYLGFILFVPQTTLDISPGQMARPFLSLYAVMALFGALAFLLSFLLPSRRTAAMATGVILVGSYFVTSLARIDENLETLADFSPMSYYQGGQALVEMNWSWFAGLLGFAVLFSLVAWWRFLRRDIRVGGEGGWRIPVLHYRRHAEG